MHAEELTLKKKGLVDKLDSLMGATIGVPYMALFGAVGGCAMTPTALRTTYQVITNKGPFAEFWNKEATTKLPKYGLIIGTGVGLWGLGEQIITGHSETYNLFSSIASDFGIGLKEIFYASAGFEFGRYRYHKK